MRPLASQHVSRTRRRRPHADDTGKVTMGNRTNYTRAKQRQTMAALGGDYHRQQKLTTRRTNRPITPDVIAVAGFVHEFDGDDPFLLELQSQVLQGILPSPSEAAQVLEMADFKASQN